MYVDMDTTMNTHRPTKKMKIVRHVNFYDGKKVNIKTFIEKYKDIKVDQLKEECMKYKLKKTGKKKEIHNRLCEYFTYNESCKYIQKIFRGYICREYMKIRKRCREKTVNDTDFYSFDKIEDIPNYQRYYFTCTKRFTYGFDIKSLYLLYKQRDKRKGVLNPYTREKFRSYEINEFKRYIRLSYCLKYDIETSDIESEKIKNQYNIQETINIDSLSFSTVRERLSQLFFKIDEHGYITDPNWLLSLSREKILRFIREISDIWNYRLNIPLETKRKIIYPNGMLFTPCINIRHLHIANLEEITKIAYKVMNRIICNGIDMNHKHLGVIYVLTSLTIVSNDAAESLPYLYQSAINT